jgi:hypothetical protein
MEKAWFQDHAAPMIGPANATMRKIEWCILIQLAGWTDNCHFCHAVGPLEHTVPPPRVL